ncbi:MAG: TrmH family RNA methyltransferase [Acidimicrobiales bacterium]
MHNADDRPRISIDDPADPQIEVFLGLRDHVARQTREQPGGDMAGSFIAEGDLVIERGLAAGYELISLLISSRRTKALPAGIGDSVDILAAADPVLEVVTGRPELRDPLARFRRPLPIDVSELLASGRSFAVLEGVNNPNNLGVIMRNAAALGVDAVLLDATCGDPLYRRAIRASMGQVFAIPHARLGPLSASLDLLHDAGIESIALVPSAEQPLLRPTGADRVAVLLGAEGPGLTPATIEAATHRMCIPMVRSVDSLNVASAAAIAFHTLRGV